MNQQYVKAEYPLSDVTARIIAAATEVHRALGPGFEEVIYQRALARELPAHQLEFSREVWMDVRYKGEKVGSKRVDFVIDEVLDYATAGGYRIYEADIRIALTWLHRARGDASAAQAEATRTMQMSVEMGYYWGKKDADEIWNH